MSKPFDRFMTPSAQALELRAADAAKRLPFWPDWMRTRWGAWFARHWRPAAYRWRAEVEQAEHRENEAREAAAAASAMIALQLWAEDDFPESMDPVVRQKMIGAWCKWRTYHERKCESAGCAPLGSARWLKAQSTFGARSSHT